jgi:hypothetical protein
MSQKNYNIQFNPPELTSEQINKHKSFDDLMAQFEASQAIKPKLRAISVNRRSWRRNLTYIASISAAAMIALVLYFNIRSQSIEQMVADKLAAMPYVAPPLQEMQKEFTTFTLDGTKGGVYEYESGSKVTVPANAFVDANGNLVTGKVELRYRELHDFVDFFLGGIPMEYDSASLEHQLISAGMIEIQAYKNNQPIQISSGKELDIELISTMEYNPDYQVNVYQLSVENRNWSYAGIDNIEPILSGDLKTKMDGYFNSTLANVPEVKQLTEVVRKIEMIKAEQETELQSTVAVVEESMAMPVKPEKVKQGDLSIEIEGKFWVADKDLEDKLKMVTNLEWASVTSEKIPNSDKYEVTFKNEAGREMKLNMRPALMGNEYERAIAEYEKQMAAYNAQSEGKDGKAEDKINAIVQKYETKLSALQVEKQRLEDKIALYRKKGYNSLLTETIASQKVINRFRVNNLGLWNCARPVIPTLQTVKAMFKDDGEKPMEFFKGYLVNKKQNTVVQFLTTGDKAVNFQYYDNADNIMWAVDREGKILMVDPKDFKEINNATQDYTFNFDKVDKQIRTEADLRKILMF